MESGGISRAWSETFCSTIVSSCPTLCNQNDINYVAASIKTLPIGRYEQLKQFFPLQWGLCKMPIQSCLHKYRAAPCWVPLFSCVKKEEINHFTLRLIMRGCQPVFRAKHGNYVLCSSLLFPRMLRGKKTEVQWGVCHYCYTPTPVRCHLQTVTVWFYRREYLGFVIRS